VYNFLVESQCTGFTVHEQFRPKTGSHVLDGGRGNLWAFPDLFAVDVSDLVSKWAAVMQPLATTSVATCVL